MILRHHLVFNVPSYTLYTHRNTLPDGCGTAAVGTLAVDQDQGHIP